MRRVSLLSPILLLLIPLSMACSEKTNAPAEWETEPIFEHYYWGEPGQGRCAVAETGDGGYLVPGFQRLNDNLDARAFLLNLDAAGDLIGVTDFGGEHWDKCWNIAALTDSTWLLAGTTWSEDPGHGRAWLMEVKRDGEVLRENSYGRGYNDILYAAQPLPGGGAVMVGRSWNPIDDVLIGYDGFLLVSDAGGAILNSAYYDRENSDAVYAVDALDDGGFLLAGLYQAAGSLPGTVFDRIWVMRTNAAGDSLWSRVFHGSSPHNADQEDDICRATGVAACSNGDVLVAGTSPSTWMGVDSHLRLIRLDEDGELLWERLYSGIARSRCNGLRLLPDGSALVWGATWNNNTPNYQSAYLLRVDSGGEVIWENIISAPSPHDLEAFAILPAANGELIVVGRYDNSMLAEMIWLTRLDADGAQLPLE